MLAETRRDGYLLLVINPRTRRKKQFDFRSQNRFLDLGKLARVARTARTCGKTAFCTNTTGWCGSARFRRTVAA
jgi:hypothetical protein